MTNPVDDAKAVLAVIRNWLDGYPNGNGFFAFDETSYAPFANLLAEYERLTAPLDADEGREFVRVLRVNGSNDAAAYIERQAAKLAALQQMPEDVAGLIVHWTAEGDRFRTGHRIRTGRDPGQNIAAETAQALRAHESRRIAERLAIEALKHEPWESIIDGVLAILAKPARAEVDE